jgi:hypothetical protein
MVVIARTLSVARRMREPGETGRARLPSGAIPL